MLAVPWAGMALALILWGGGRFNAPWNRQSEVITLLVGLFFLDGVHVTYTFVLVLGLAELRDWARKDIAAADFSPSDPFRMNFGFWRQVFFVGIALSALFYFLRFSSFNRTMPTVVFLFLLIDAFGPSQHTLAQMRGISFCFHSAIRKTADLNVEELRSAARVEEREKNLFRILLGADVLAAIPSILILAKVVGPHTYPDLFHDLRNFGAAALVATVLGIFLNGARYPRQKTTGKMLYLSRIVLYPIRVFLWPAGLVVRACHGTEYLVILRQIVKNSSASEATRRNIFLATIGASILYGVVFTLTFPLVLKNWAQWREPNSIFVYALMTSLVIRYLHYYMDGVLYRMKDQKTRIVVGPMLVNMKAPAAVMSVPTAAA